MNLAIEDTSLAAPGRRTAVGVGGALFALSSTFAAAVTAGFIQGGVERVGSYFAMGLPDFGVLAVLMALAPVSTVTLWRWYVAGSGVAIVFWPTGLIVQWFRGFAAGDPVSNVLNGMTWYAVLGCALLGGLLIAIASVTQVGDRLREARMHSRDAITWWRRLIDGRDGVGQHTAQT
jgi:hypothetical protein